MNKELMYVIGQMANEKGIDKEVLFEAVESALLSASKKTMGLADNVRMELDRHTGALKVFARKKVVETVTDRKLEISLEEARRLNGEAQLDDELEMELPPQEFGRIAAQTAKQVIFQKIREAERDVIFNEFNAKADSIVTGTVYRFEKGSLLVDLGKTEAVLPRRELSPRDNYRQGDHIRAYVLEVSKNGKGPQIVLSRTHPGFVKTLFELEVPEIADGMVEIRAVSREAGDRSKIAVWSKNEKIDCVGACVGIRGSRVKGVVKELQGEKIDIVRWSDDPEEFVRAALSPAEASSVKILSREEKKVEVVVADDQLSLAIGKNGQNVRLASRLVGWSIEDRKSVV